MSRTFFEKKFFWKITIFLTKKPVCFAQKKATDVLDDNLPLYVLAYLYLLILKTFLRRGDSILGDLTTTIFIWLHPFVIRFSILYGDRGASVKAFLRFCAFEIARFLFAF